jgi:hypothetical protein
MVLDEEPQQYTRGPTRVFFHGSNCLVPEQEPQECTRGPRYQLGSFPSSWRMALRAALNLIVSIKNPRWSKDEITQWVKRMEKINYWFNIEKEGKEVDPSLPSSIWKEEQIEPTPIRSREICYSCKVS